MSKIVQIATKKLQDSNAVRGEIKK
jgi:hypothetical protein